MIYTVTFNPSLDYIVGVDDFRLGATNRTSYEQMLAGGKGINVSYVLKNLGFESTALGFLAGFVGEEIRRKVAADGIHADFLTLSEGVSRINVKLKNIDGTEINGMGPDTRYSGPVKVAQTITSALGTGGNNTPLAVHGEPYCIAGNVINRQDKNGGNGCGYQQGVSYTLTTEDRHCVAYTDDLRRKKRVRKLIPLECERLMGFPDHWTDIPGASDSVRYRALGNSVAVPCVEYILCGIAYFLERQEGERDVHIPG